MPRLRESPILTSDLEEYLQARDDFALEMHVYKLARDLRFSVSHGGTYNDPVTRKARQYDIRAIAQNGEHCVALAIECKSLKPSYPLLISQIPRTERESYHCIIFGDKDAPPEQVSIRAIKG